ncbi:NAD(P)-dependent dehydrogenase (short-subunit alcohol dehydrogenase family) [Novosphingobium chloroacetimidivorans]|uniref:NAD(P)-dependent dehydrogenase (Short-subunit alcohol dehydrogenase family) n=1 Tax=Novosphingobium chloroacetimidivorans TaxID=1428314 RepID=A0A7W7NXV2_9SPHN|nr:SDR family oxidoreductase [Novosphingobium chloroacetimidivorans]MBB4860766.1 NAD(P)-dependent dehydrogenase (short-subunit alcohol dehydrogenase family) [Novosphingobium chloroacetimidivorans]
MSDDRFAGEFAGKTVIVTGAASGLGKVTAAAFARSGADVAMVDIDRDGLEQSVEAVRAEGGSARPILADLSQSDVGSMVIDATVQAFGTIDVLVNVAGVFHFSPVPQTTAEAWDRVFAINLRAPFLLCQAALPHLVERAGAIVNIASSSAFFGHAYLTAYGASKAALVSLTKSLAMEYARTPVRINALAPGGMMTPMVSGMTSMSDGIDRDLVSRYGGLRPPNEPEDLVDLILFLASPRATAVHGACFAADRGITAG